MGLGSYPVIPVKEARTAAFEFRKLLELGMDPIEERSRLAKRDQVKSLMPTFEEAARQLHADLSSGYRNKNPPHNGSTARDIRISVRWCTADIGPIGFRLMPVH